MMRTMTDSSTRRRLVKPLDGAEIVFDERSAAAAKRLNRMADAGLIKCVRSGPRGDRLYSSAELEALVASAESNA